MIKNVIKRDGSVEAFNIEKVVSAVKKAFPTGVIPYPDKAIEGAIEKYLPDSENVGVEHIQDCVENCLHDNFPYKVAKAYMLYRAQHLVTREFAKSRQQFISKYTKSDNTANASIDDNSNVANKNIAVLNSELYKDKNIEVNRYRVMEKLKELYPDFDYKNYIKDLKHHTIYKNDENSTFGFPYCTSITMYPFLTDGIKSIGGLSAAPKNLDSFCGMFVNLVFAISTQYAGAVATSEFLLYFDYFARKEWGNNYYQKEDVVITNEYSSRKKTIKSQIEQYFQQIVYSINQPAAARGYQSVFWNVSIFDKPFFDGMFGNFVFPDATKPQWESLQWLQKLFMKWFNAERLKCVLTFPVVSYSLLYKDNNFQDKEAADFVAEELSEGNSFFIYISDSVDSLASCCFSKDTKILWKSSTKGVQLTTLEELHNLKWESDKKNLRIFHNGSWIRGKSIKLPSRTMYRIVTENNKEFIVTDNHIHVTFEGEKPTTALTTEDYLMFNTSILEAVPENDEHLTYEQGFVIGSFLGDGSFSSAINNTIYDVQFSQNASKYQKCLDILNVCAEQMSLSSRGILGSIHNNVYPIRISSKYLVAFIQKWTLWERGTYAYNKKLNLDCLLQSKDFRKGILDGWYNTDGGNSNRCYTTSPELAKNMEILITSLGMNSIINVSDRTDEKVIIREQEFNRNYPLYCVRWYTPANHRVNKDAEHSWKKKNNSIFFKLKSIEKIEYTGPVYCIECNNADEPYFTLPSGLITHNCRLKNKLQTHEFNFTNGNMGVETGSKSVITLNINRIIQDCNKTYGLFRNGGWKENTSFIKEYLTSILERVYKYHTAYNELLWDLYNANLLPAYKAGFIDLNRQYLTVGISGLTASADFLGIPVNDNLEYSKYCQFIFSIIKEQNIAHKTKKTTYNTELIPAESAGAKLYNYDKEDGYYVPTDINLYTSYIFKPYDDSISILDKLKMHGKHYIGDFLDGGAACHVNLDSHPDKTQCKKLLYHAAEVGCQYWTINVPNCECNECGFIAKQPFKECPKCGSNNVALWDRIIGYLTKIKNWSEARQIEQKTRVYAKIQ